MSITIAQQKKHLLLLNRLHRNALKAELIPTPSKLSDDKVEKLFNEFFKKKDHYYVPKTTPTILKIDEEEFKKLYKEPKQKKEVEKKEIKKEEIKIEPKLEIKKEVYGIIESLDNKDHDFGSAVNYSNIKIKDNYYLFYTKKDFDLAVDTLHFSEALNQILKRKLVKIIDNKEEISKILKKIYNTNEEPKEEIDKEKIKNEKIIKLKSVIDSIRGRHLTGHYGLMKSYDEAYEYLTIDEKKKFFFIIKSLYESFKENLLNKLNSRDNHGDYLDKYKNDVYGLKNKISNLTESIKQKRNLKTKKARENAFPIIEKYEKEIKEAETTIKYLTEKTDKITEEIKKIKEISFNSLDDIQKYQSLESVKNLFF